MKQTTKKIEREKQATRRAKKGFTLAEVMITVTVIGTITAIAVPNFYRLREEVNWETARQNLKVIHEAMNELLNESGLFPDDIFGFTDEDGDARAAIAANLTAIDTKGFDTNFENLDGEYFLRSCSTVLGRCFGVDPLGVHTLFAFDGRGVSSFMATSDPRVQNFDFLVDPNIPNDVKAEIMSAMIESFMGSMVYDGHLPTHEDGLLPAFQMMMSNESGLAYDQISESLFPEMYENLKAAGFETMYQDTADYEGAVTVNNYAVLGYIGKSANVIFQGTSSSYEYSSERTVNLMGEVNHFLATGDWDGAYLYEDMG